MASRLDLLGWDNQPPLPTARRPHPLSPNWFKSCKGKTLLAVIGIIAAAALAVGIAATGGVPVLAILGAVGAKQLIIAGSALLIGVTYVALTRLNPWFKLSREIERVLDVVVGLVVTIMLVVVVLTFVLHGAGTAMGASGGMR